MAYNINNNNAFQNPYGVYPQSAATGYGKVGYGANQYGYGANPNSQSFYPQQQFSQNGYGSPSSAYQQPSPYTRSAPQQIVYMMAPPPESRKNTWNWKKIASAVAGTTLLFTISGGLALRFLRKPATRDAKKGVKEIIDAFLKNLSDSMSDKAFETKFSELLSAIRESNPGAMTAQQFKERFNHRLEGLADAEPFKTKLNGLLDAVATKTADQAMTIEEFQAKFNEHIAAQQAEQFKTTAQGMVQTINNLPTLMTNVQNLVTKTQGMAEKLSPVVDELPDMTKQAKEILAEGKDAKKTHEDLKTMLNELRNSWWYKWATWTKGTPPAPPITPT
jgi:methyl-accepting chemotaxis protein